MYLTDYSVSFDERLVCTLKKLFSDIYILESKEKSEDMYQFQLVTVKLKYRL